MNISIILLKNPEKPSEYCKADLGYKNVKNYEFVKQYFANVDKLIDAIFEYRRASNLPKGEYSLNDLLN